MCWAGNQPPRVGSDTGNMTQYGRTVYRTPSATTIMGELINGGENVSEKSVTFPLKSGEWLNIPSIHGGRQYSGDDLFDMYNRGQIKATSIHKSEAAAIAAAKERSLSLRRVSKTPRDYWR